MINRRELLGAAATVGTASVLGAKPTRADDQEQPRFEIVDTNVSLFQWPFRRLPLDDSAALVKKLRAHGVALAWAGSLEAILHRDIASVNQRLADRCNQYAELLPIGSINVALPNWEDDLLRCLEQHDMPGLRLYPNYHEYTLDDPRFARLLELAAKARRFVQIAVAMEDTRTQHPMLQVDDVDVSPLPELMRRVAQAKVQLLNFNPRPPLLEKLAEAPRIYFDTARVEGTDGVPKLIEHVPNGRVMFGSHAPLLIPESALIRVHESSLLDPQSLRMVLSKNANHLLRTVRDDS